MILITRPHRQAISLAEKIQAQGGHSIIFPTLEIVPLFPPPLLSSGDIAIFVSANAVDYGPPLSPEKFSKQMVIAIGTGTACALQKKD